MHFLDFALYGHGHALDTPLVSVEDEASEGLDPYALLRASRANPLHLHRISCNWVLEKFTFH